ncbi:copper resistance protein NlpE [Luteimonas sp. SX5]|uniref:Copper resistance protein NlpE n=1 Tax=Luteimonas galliterrae TaxID=2940486 RepID=A0ABT0MEK5_9GAMM|nr:copper resistance protein NlpE [Luteimonas galliterrae]MCL1633299.1 copper resistance protein NlpE [Luteimonas galliterrae]
MKQTWIITGIALTALALPGCKKEAAPEAAAPAAPAAEAAAPADPALAAAAAPTDFDMRSFAGSFSGTLPCADCAGTDTRIALAGDGTYTIDETYQGKATAPARSDGHWTAEDNGHRLRLDPNSKSDADRLFEIVGKDEIRLMDKDGNAMQGAQNFSLKRVAAQ